MNEMCRRTGVDFVEVEAAVPTEFGLTGWGSRLFGIATAIVYNNVKSKPCISQ